VLSISRAVEKSVLELMGGTTAEYKSKIRSLFVNLKDKANPALRASIVDGSLAPEKFARMTSQVGFPFYLLCFVKIMNLL
jgi:transcription elongation factor S-II